MTGTLTFALPEEQNEFDMAAAAPKMLSVIWDISQELRRHRKYVPHDDEAAALVEELERFLYETLEEHGVALDRWAE